MITIFPSEVPAYLLRSEFYKQLVLEEDVAIDIPTDCFKLNTSITEQLELTNLLITLCFWVSGDIPADLMDHILTQPDESWCHITVEFESRLLYLETLKNISRCILIADQVKLAIKSGRQDILTYILQKNPALNQSRNAYCTLAAMEPSMEILQQLHELEFLWNEGTCQGAAAFGNLNCLKYAHEHGCPWSQLTCYQAVYYSQYECLKYAVEHGCAVSPVRLPDRLLNNDSLTGDIFCIALASGSLECLRFLHEHDLPWPLCMYRVVRQFETKCNDEQHLLCCTYAHEHGCPPSAGLVRLAIQCGHLQVLKYVMQQDFPWPVDLLGSLSHTGATAEQQECIAYAHEQGCT